MKIYYNGKYKEIDKSGKEIIHKSIIFFTEFNTEVTEIEIEPGTTIIEENAFAGCYNLQKVTIPDSVTIIGNSAFADCNALEIINMPQNLKIIDDDAFQNCKNLQKIIFPNTLKHIGKGAFLQCKSLKSVIFNSNCTIERTSFMNCWSLDDDIKEKIFFKIAKNIELANIQNFFDAYDITYSHELIQELMIINVGFFDIAARIDQEVFIEAALDSINNIYKKDNNLTIETDLCNIYFANNKSFIKITEYDYLTLENHFYEKIRKIIKNYEIKEETER